MKRIVYILTIFLFTGFSAIAQADNGDARIRDKMKEFIERRMGLTKNESEKFTPVFIRYFKEWRTTLHENKGDRLVLQQKIIEVKLKYRPEFKDILGEQRSNEVYKEQEVFIRGLDNIRKERVKERMETRPQRVQKLSPE